MTSRHIKWVTLYPKSYTQIMYAPIKINTVEEIGCGLDGIQNTCIFLDFHKVLHRNSKEFRKRMTVKGEGVG